MEQIRVLIADDHAIVREGLRTLLEQAASIHIVGEASDGAAAVRQSQILRPDVVLLDLRMPGMDGIAAIKEILAERPHTRILVLTNFDDNDSVFAALRAGAQGYLLKDVQLAQLVQAIHDVHRGESALHPIVARKVLSEMHRPEAPPTLDRLTERELDVLRLVAQGLSYAEVGDRLFISPRTVARHLQSIYGKLDVASRAEAAAFAYAHGLV